MGKTNQNIEHTKKVTLLKYKDTKETLILSKTIKRKVTIKVKYNTKIKKQLIDTESIENYPLLQPQLKDRITPCCCRAKCFRKQKLKKLIKKEKYKHKGLENTLKGREMSLSPISSIDDDLNNNSVYETISSDDLSFSTDDEIESLIKSTRKRMMDLDDNFKLLPRNTSSPISKQIEKLDSSINSLETLLLEVDDTKHSEMYDLHNDVYSPTINTETKIKYEYLETNNNDTKISHDFMDEETLYNNSNIIKNKLDTMTPKLNNDLDNFSNLKINNICIKQEIYDDL